MKDAATGREPVIAVPGIDVPGTAVPGTAVPGTDAREPRHAPERGLVRRLREAHGEQALAQIARHHRLDERSRAALLAALAEAAPAAEAEAALAGALGACVALAPIGADALRAVLLLGTDREARREATAALAADLRAAGRAVTVMAERDGADIRYEGAEDCRRRLAAIEPGSLTLVEAGLRAPLEHGALERVRRLCEATGAEPVLVARPRDALQALALRRVGGERLVLALRKGEARVGLGPLLSALTGGEARLAGIAAGPRLVGDSRAALARILLRGGVA